MEYRAIYSGESLSHGRFKYIDKWRSKSGKWVYKYAEDLKDKAKSLLENEAQTQDSSEDRKSTNGNQRGRTEQWHSTGSDKTISNRERFHNSVWGYDQTRSRIVTNSQGQKVNRREYRSSSENASLNKTLALNNAAYRKYFGPAVGFVMKLNDKYGPKKVVTIEEKDTKTGRQYVEEYTVNRIGNRAISVDAYTYSLSSDKLLRRKKNVRRPNRKARK